MTRKQKAPSPTEIYVVQSQSVGDILARTKGLLEFIRLACESTIDESYPESCEVERAFTPDLVRSLSKMCLFAARDGRRRFQ